MEVMTHAYHHAVQVHADEGVQDHIASVPLRLN